MNFLGTIPLELRLTLLFLVGVSLGSLANLAAFAFAWKPRGTNPWAEPPQGAPPRGWADRLPLLGWFRLRREAKFHHRGFWLRPLAIEILCGVGCAALYWWEVDQQAMLPPLNIDVALSWKPLSLAVLHTQYAVHLVVIFLMLVASVIDTEEKIIPDEITVPGTLLGLLIAVALPSSALANAVLVNPPSINFLHPASAEVLPDWMAAAPNSTSLGVALACIWFWCFALLPRYWRGRRGIAMALRLIVARVLRERVSRILVGIGLVASGVIVATWYAGGPRWNSLLSALVGMVGGALIIWAVRIIGTLVLRREAMGFGDVTLMAMIGSFVGWQMCLIVFFVAPLTALFVGILQFVLKRDDEIPYGPFLCLATLLLLVRWADVWSFAGPFFSIGLLVPIAMVGVLALMAVLLAIIQILKRLFRAVF